MLSEFKFAVRQLAKSPGFTFVAIFTLALGIGACTSLFSVVNSVLLRPLPYPDSGSLVVLNETKLPQFPQFPVSWGDYFDWREQSTSFENLAAVRLDGFNLTGRGDPIMVIGEHVTANYLAVLRLHPFLGRDFSEEEAATKANVVLLSHALWLRQFGSRPEIVNQIVKLNDSAFTIIGVLPASFDPGNGAEIFTLAPYTERSQDHGAHVITVIGRLKSGVTLAQARNELTLIASRLEKQYPKTNTGWGVKLTPMLESTVGDVRPMLYSLLGAVGFLLLIACANVANLLLARATARAKEISLRVALGASRARIVRQLLSESVLLAGLGGTIGALLAWWGMKTLVAFAPESLPRAQEISIDFRSLGFTCALAVITGIGFGLVPAFQASRVNINENLKDSGRGTTTGGRRQRARSALVVAEVAIALILLVGAGLLIRSFTRLQSVNPGFRPAGAIAVTLLLPPKEFGTAPQKNAFVAEVTSKLATLHGVQSVGVTSVIPFSIGDTTYSFNIAGQPSSPSPDAQSTVYCAVTPDYFKAMGVPILRGRFFTDRDTAGAPPVAIINESMAKKFFSGKDPIGQRINFGYPSKTYHEIVGIVGDVKTMQLSEEAKVQTYEPFAQEPFEYMTIVVRGSGTASDLPSAIRSVIYSIHKDQPIMSVRPVTELLAASVARQRFTMFLFAVFSSVALLLAMIGIYGVMAYSVVQRTGEIGIRMALGAQRANVLRLIFLQGGRLVALGLVCGVAGALLLTRLVSSMLFGVSAQDPVTFAAIAVLLGTVAAVACLIPAWRAMKVDPIIALRAE